MTPAPKVNISPSKGWNVQPAQYSRVTKQPMKTIQKAPQINKPKAMKKIAKTPKGKQPLTKADIVADSEGYQP